MSFVIALGSTLEEHIQAERRIVTGGYVRTPGAPREWGTVRVVVTSRGECYPEGAQAWRQAVANMVASQPSR